MPEPFKLLLNPALVRNAAAHLQRSWRGFPATDFEALALHDFDALQMKARAMQIATALDATLPQDFEHAARTIQGALAPVRGDEDLATLRASSAGLAGWICWPLGELIARRGLAYPERALAALHALTQRFTAEFAIRPFILAHPQLAFETLSRWTADPSAHVRRLVSEGSRPRLPWGIQLKPLIADPAPTLPLLRALLDDPSEYVRRSVANHLNDIAKDHPQIVAEWLREHLPHANAARRALLRHASRTLVKRGDPATLAAWGLGGKLRGAAQLKLMPQRVRIGAAIELVVELVAHARTAQKLAIDYRIHHVRADGSTGAKVCKGWLLELAPGECRELRKRHSLRPITTRRYYPGRHQIALVVNGRVVAEAAFMLIA